MKTTLFTLALAAVHLAAFAQGKVTFGNANHPIMVDLPWDMVGFIPAPQVGTPNDVMGHLTAQLWAGTTAGNMTLQSTVAPAGLAGFAPGILRNTLVTLAGVPAGPAFFQIYLWETVAGSYEAAVDSPGLWFGSTAVFTADAGSFAGTPIANSPGWPAGPITLTTGFPYYFGGFWAQPTNQTVVAGRAAAFYVGASAYPSPSYQWHFNGAPISGANSSSYQISSVQPNNAGSYHVVLSNPSWGVHSSTDATLMVLTEPVITSGLQSQTAEMDTTAGFGVSASGTLPLAYQWLFNGTNVRNDATNQVLQVTNVQSGHAGAYVVVVTNLVGSVTSAPALLSVITPVERRWVPGLILSGQPGNALNLDFTDTLVPEPNWAALDSVMLTNPSQWYFDLTTPLATQRFFRAWQAGAADVTALEAHLVPALTLTGSVGNTVRVDAINQFGSTDAWFPLATVTLTNTLQFYFDVSVIGQQARLWRLIQVP